MQFREYITELENQFEKYVEGAYLTEEEALDDYANNLIRDGLIGNEKRKEPLFDINDEEKENNLRDLHNDSFFATAVQEQLGNVTVEDILSYPVKDSYWFVRNLAFAYIPGNEIIEKIFN